MTKDLVAKASIAINTSAEKAWDALINPKTIKEYMFGTDTVSSWSLGSSIEWSGQWQGKSYKDKGKILKMDDHRTLQYTHYSPLSGKEDKQENYHTVTVGLKSEGEQTIVSVEQDNNESDKVKEDSEKNWKIMLENLKNILEK